MINNPEEHIFECQHYDLCATVLYSGKCAKQCIEKYNKKSNIAYWHHRAKYNDFLWVECSNCGFLAENYKAVILDGSDTRFSGVKYKYCPICGKEMRVY